jgi:hypothetical protein
MIDAVKTLRNIDLEYVLGSKFNAVEDRRNGIPTGPTGAKPIEMCWQFRFPLGFQGLAYDGLSRPFMQGWHPERPLFRRAAFGYPNTSERGGCVVKRELVG